MLRFISGKLVAVGFASQVLAWGSTGHRVTGAIAEPMLSDTARGKRVS